MHGVPSLDHVSALSDDVAIAQHARYDVPNRKEGYCTDDVARAFIVACAAARYDALRDASLRIARTSLAFLADAQMPDGRFHNFMSYARTWLDEVGTEDSNGRAMWALGYGSALAPRDAWRQLCRELLAGATPHATAFSFLRPGAYAALGLAHAFEASGRRDPLLARALRQIGAGLVARHTATASRDWDWFEAELTYDNARLCEALLRIGTVLDDREFLRTGLRTFEFYASVVMENGIFVPVGNEGWYRRGGRRARYAQQPLEAAAMLDAALAARAATGDVRYRSIAAAALAWFYGNNTRGAVLAQGGGCFDGLEKDGVNQNMGAESTLAYLASALAMADAGAELPQLVY